MTNAKVAIELYVDDKGSLRIKQFASDSEKAFQDVERSGTGAAARIKSGWQALQGAWVSVVAGIMAVHKAWDMANMAAKARQEEVAFANLAASYGTNSRDIVASLKKASGQTIDTMTLIRNAGTAMMMGIAPDKVTELMKIARATAKMTGQTTVKAFEDISLAVGRQSKMILDNLGIIVDVEKANATYANSLGKTGTQLTDVEKKQAFMNATLAAGGELMEKMGNQEDTAADKLERWRAGWANATVVVGRGILTIGMGVELLFTTIGAGVNEAVGQLSSVPAKIAGVLAKIPLAGKLLQPWATTLKGIEENSKGAADIGLKHMQETWESMLAVWQQGEPVANKALQNLKEQAKSSDDLAKSQGQLLAAQKKEAADKVRDTKEMYEQLGQGGEAYFSAEASALVQKAAKWKKAGADTLAVEDWLYDQIGQLSAKAWEKEDTAAGLAMDNLQAQTSTIVDEMNSVTQQGVDALQQYGLQIEGLNGTEFTVYAALDGSGMESTVDTLIAKFRQLQAVAASQPAAPAAPATSSPQPYENTNSSLSAAQVAAEQASYNNTTININQQLSRSDVNAVLSEQSRQEDRT